MAHVQGPFYFFRSSSSSKVVSSLRLQLFISDWLQLTGCSHLLALLLAPIGFDADGRCSDQADGSARLRMFSSFFLFSSLSHIFFFLTISFLAPTLHPNILLFPSHKAFILVATHKQLRLCPADSYGSRHLLPQYIDQHNRLLNTQRTCKVDRHRTMAQPEINIEYDHIKGGSGRRYAQWQNASPTQHSAATVPSRETNRGQAHKLQLSPL